MKRRSYGIIILAMCSLMLFACGKKENTPVENTVTVESQTLGLSGIGNARQLGGYKTEDGRTVKKDLLLRTAKLADATEEDIDTLVNTYHVTEVVDFRTSSEIELAPNPEIPGVKNIEIRIIPDSVFNEVVEKSTAVYSADMASPQFALSLYKAGVYDIIYDSMFETDTSIDGYRQFLDILLEHDDGAILWHCTSGKDRTGVGAMIILTLLGVDKETILRDYALTNDFVSDEVEELRKAVLELTDDPEEVEGALNMCGVSRPLMEAVYDRAEKESGSMLVYLKTKLNITDDEVKTLQEKYLD